MTIREALGDGRPAQAQPVWERGQAALAVGADGAVYREILTQHETQTAAFAGLYAGGGSDGTVLLIEWPYDEIYRWYLEMKIDDANGEMTKYNNSAAKYNMYYQAYQNAYNRAHLPKSEAAYIKL